MIWGSILHNSINLGSLGIGLKGVLPCRACRVEWGVYVVIRFRSLGRVGFLDFRMYKGCILEVYALQGLVFRVYGYLIP